MKYDYKKQNIMGVRSDYECSALNYNCMEEVEYLLFNGEKQTSKAPIHVSVGNNEKLVSDGEKPRTVINISYPNANTEDERLAVCLISKNENGENKWYEFDNVEHIGIVVKGKTAGDKVVAGLSHAASPMYFIDLLCNFMNVMEMIVSAKPINSRIRL